MQIRNFFTYSPTLDLTAAHIGINKWDWVTIDSKDEDKAKKIMANNRFDVLPICDNSGKLVSFFATREWNNFNSLNEIQISESDIIYYRTSITDLLQKFSEENRFYYFLSNHKEILGLVSFVNLNTHPVYNYFFQLVSNVEIHLAKLFENEVDQKVVCESFRTSGINELNQIASIFEENIRQGADNSIYSFMYLKNFGTLLNNFGDQLPQEVKPILSYKSKFAGGNLYSNIRNRVMHPVNPIVSNNSDVSELTEFLNDYEHIMDIFSSYKKRGQTKINPQ